MQLEFIFRPKEFLSVDLGALGEMEAQRAAFPGSKVRVKYIL
jgi:hypothetical protein